MVHIQTHISANMLTNSSLLYGAIATLTDSDQHSARTDALTLSAEAIRTSSSICQVSLRRLSASLSSLLFTRTLLHAAHTNGDELSPRLLVGSRFKLRSLSSGTILLSSQSRSWSQSPRAQLVIISSFLQMCTSSPIVFQTRHVPPDGAWLPALDSARDTAPGRRIFVRNRIHARNRPKSAASFRSQPPPACFSSVTDADVRMISSQSQDAPSASCLLPVEPIVVRPSA